jgi:DegV family protein with EDD domain
MLPKADIHVIDTRSVSAPLAFIVIEAARMAEVGADVDTIKSRIAHMSEGFQIFFSVDTLEFLRRGGRIGGAAALLGTALKTKPILSVQDGRIEPFERVRTRARAVARLRQLVHTGLDVDRDTKKYLAVVHGNAADEGAALHAELVEEFRPDETMMLDLTPAIATHTGPGVLAVAFFQD